VLFLLLFFGQLLHLLGLDLFGVGDGVIGFGRRLLLDFALGLTPPFV
jgi:hypothetical protein